MLILDGGVGGPMDRLLGVGEGDPNVKLGGPTDGTPRLMLESESSLWATGLCDVSLHLLGLLDILLLPPLCECREWANWAAANCWCCNLKQIQKIRIFNWIFYPFECEIFRIIIFLK